MPELYLIRHGETDFNLRNIVQGGGVDSDLNQTGRDQAQAFFQRYRNIEFDQVFCTGLKRTSQTLVGFEDAGWDLQVMPTLNEFNWGRLEGMEATPEVRAEFRRVTSAWREGHTEVCVEAGESPAEAWKRAKKGLELILDRTPAKGKALICAHGRIIRVILSQLSGYGLRYMDLFPHHNTALNLISVNGTDRFHFRKLNDTTHLQ